MLSKSIKHEFRATSRIMLPMILALLALSIATHFSPKILEYGSVHWLLKTVAILLLVLFFVGIMIVAVGTIVVGCKRFYQSFFSDEGYLNMTLPTTAHTHITSRVIVIFIWNVLMIIAIVLSVMLVFLDTSAWGQFFDGFSDFFSAVWHGLQSLEAGQQWTTIAVGFEILLAAILSQILSTLMIYAAIAIGYSFNKYKKLLAIVFAIVFYYAVQLGSIIYVVSSTGSSFLPDLTNSFTKLPLALLLILVPELAVCTLFYMLTYFFMTRKLNLE